MWSMRKTQSAIVGFKDCGRGRQTKEYKWLQSWGGLQTTEIEIPISILPFHVTEFCEEPKCIWKWILPRDSQKEPRWPTPGFSLVLTGAEEPDEPTKRLIYRNEIINGCCFKLLICDIYYRSNRKWIHISLWPSFPLRHRLHSTDWAMEARYMGWVTSLNKRIRRL